MSNRVTRTWNDRLFADGRSNNFVPDCNLTDPQPNGECGIMSDVNFGSQTRTTAYDEDVLRGWGVRPYNWEFSVGVQQEIVPRVSANVAYYRRWYGNFGVTDNLAVEPSDYDPYSIAIPANPRAARRRRRPRHGPLRPEPEQGRPGEQPFRPGQRLRRANRVLARHRRHDERAAEPRHHAAGWFQYREDGDRYLRHRPDVSQQGRSDRRRRHSGEHRLVPPGNQLALAGEAAGRSTRFPRSPCRSARRCRACPAP